MIGMLSTMADMMPISTLLDPVNTSQALVALMSAPAVPPVCPVFSMPQRSGNRGSLGVSFICTT